MESIHKAAGKVIAKRKKKSPKHKFKNLEWWSKRSNWE
jgi:hypothetical protein